MAPDRLSQLGKSFRQQRKEIEASTRHFSKNFPLIEESEDIVGSINTFEFEFKTYTTSTIVKLNLVFKQKVTILSARDRIINE